MKSVVQRVSRAAVRVDGQEIAAIGAGMLVLVCVMEGDGEVDARRLAERIARFRFFPEAQSAAGTQGVAGAAQRGAPNARDRGRMHRSALDLALEALVVSQFTLAADGRAGRRPSFDGAAEPGRARALYETFVSAMREVGLNVRTGAFGARMEIELVNDGPVTFVLEETGARAAG